MFGTTSVLELLRSEGYRATPNYVAYLLREGMIPKPTKGPGGALLWRPGDILALRDELQRRGRGPRREGTSS